MVIIGIKIEKINFSAHPNQISRRNIYGNIGAFFITSPSFGITRKTKREGG